MRPNNYKEKEERMLRKIIIVFICAFVTTCCSHTQKDNHKDPAISIEFLPYVYQFVKDSQGLVTYRDLINLDMSFADFDDNKAGTCYQGASNQVIKINRQWWKEHKNKRQRLELIYHELGHCILDRRHTAPTSSKGLGGNVERTFFDLGFYQDIPPLSDGCPASFMHPYTVDLKCINKHYDYYIDELFGFEDAIKYEYKTIRITVEEL